MAPSTKSRNNRRPSSTSYTSTLTTLVFIALCVLAVWMLTSNSVVSPKTRASINTATNDLSSSSEDQAETTTAAATTTTNNNSEESSETTTSINNSDDSTGTTTTTTEDSPETTTKSQDQKDTTTTVYGDDSGKLPDDSTKNDDGNVNANDQKSIEPEKDEQSNQKDEQNTEPQNSNAGENPEQNTGGQQDVQTFDQGSKVNDDEALNEQQLREDKGEITEKDQKQSSNEEQKENQNNLQDESQETEKPKAGKSRRKWSKPVKKEPKESKSWSSQADESRGENDRQKDESGGGGGGGGGGDEEGGDLNWNLCNVTAGADFIPCLDNEKYLKTSHRKHYEHRERHCPEDAPTCLVPLPKGYKTRIQWPSSRDKVWYHNVPHTELAEVKGHQNWVKLKGEFLTFPGGGTQFIHGALHYIDFLQKAEPGIGWGKHTRVILDVGCGVGSFGGYLFERDVIAMSFAPKDEHEAQVQFALERGIPAISAVMGTQRLQFPSHVFDLIHCARCRVPWHEDGGLLLLELNRLLRPGGYFVWSATPVYQTLEEDVEIWKHMTRLTKAMCWDLVTIKNDTLNQVGAAFYRKPISNECYEQREQNQPPMCKDDDDPNAAWYVPLQACLHKLAADKGERGARWPEAWPRRLQKAPYWLNNLHISPNEFEADNERWKNVVDELSSLGVTWSNVRNIMDMRAVYGGFGAALKDLPVWVFNVVNMDAPDTLPIIFERGLIGIYHDWCESFSTYPRTYDLLHADHLFSNLKNRCKLVPVLAEVDRITRPGGNLIVRDESSVVEEVENLLKSLHWEITKNQEGLLCAKRGTWRPNSSVNLF